MNRRTWIQTAIVLPAAAALPAAAQAPAPSAAKDEFAKIDTAGSPEQGGDPVHRFFSKDHYAALEKLAGQILPAVGTRPGAVEAGVPAFLDFLISQSPADRQKLYRDGLDRLHKGATIDSLTEPWTYKTPTDPFKRFLREAKEDILQATFASREWIAARSERRGGSGTYYLAVE